MSDLGSRGLHGRWGGGLSKIPLKGSGTEKSGGETKILEMVASSVKGWVAIKAGGWGAGYPFMNYCYGLHILQTIPCNSQITKSLT